MALEPSSFVDVLIVGNGPAALILSFILHGNIPYYDLDHPHPDPILHAKLAKSPCLLQLDVDELTAHFDASRISYSTQALPANVLLDTLLRPLADVEPGEHEPCIVWKREPERAVSHLVVGDSPQAGGQWADNPVSASWDIGALSYIDQLSLPGYTLYDHLKTSLKSLKSSVERPTRRQLTEYFAAYPAVVGIQDSVRCGSDVSGIERTSDGFFVSSHNLRCRHLVLASGIFTRLLPPPPEMGPLQELNINTGKEKTGPILVVGSGFSAADVIISNVQKRKILHLFRWQLDGKPSPLQACHPQAYPDYASIYRHMKQASAKHLADESLSSPAPRKLDTFFEDWVWAENYEGIPNGVVKEVQVHDDSASITIETPNEGVITRQVASFSCVIGRKGSLSYMENDLQLEVLDESGLEGLPPSPPPKPNELVSGRTLREKTMIDVEVADRVYAVGSLTGDSLVRFAYGGCVQAAGHIIPSCLDRDDTPTLKCSSNEKTPERRASPDRKYHDTYHLTNGHEDLGGERGQLREKYYNDQNEEPSSKCCSSLGKCNIQ